MYLCLQDPGGIDTLPLELQEIDPAMTKVLECVALMKVRRWRLKQGKQGQIVFMLKKQIFYDLNHDVHQAAV